MTVVCVFRKSCARGGSDSTEQTAIQQGNGLIQTTGCKSEERFCMSCKSKSLDPCAYANYSTIYGTRFTPT